jgi:hypothetical protein
MMIDDAKIPSYKIKCDDANNGVQGILKIE